MAAPEPYDHIQIDGPCFATLQIITVRHNPRGNITVEKRRRSIGTTALVKPPRFVSIARGWGGLCTVCPIGQSAKDNPQGTIGLTVKRKATQHR